MLTKYKSLVITANVVPSSPILVTLKMEAIHSFESSVPKTATLCNLSEDLILRNIKDYLFPELLSTDSHAISTQQINIIIIIIIITAKKVIYSIQFSSH
jgi:hypothetical protein